RRALRGRGHLRWQGSCLDRQGQARRVRRAGYRSVRGQPGFFRPEARAAPGRGPGEPVGHWGWADAIQLLISRGHRLEDIRHYTRRQIRLFTEAAVRARNRDRADAVIDLRVASKYEQSQFNSYLRALRR